MWIVTHVKFMELGETDNSAHVNPFPSLQETPLITRESASSVANSLIRPGRVGRDTYGWRR